MLETFISKLPLYSGCATPSVVFFLVTRKERIKCSTKSSPDWLLILLGFVEVLVPLFFDGRGTTLDRAICAIMATVMTSSMFFYIRDRRLAAEGQVVAPFYDFLSRWNEAPEKNHKKDDEVKDIPLATIRWDAFKFLLRAAVYALVYIPVFATMDGFIRACQEPPETFAAIPYWHRLFRAPIPLKSTFYFIWIGIALVLHIAIVPLIHLLLHAIQLNMVAWMPNVKRSLLLKLHSQLCHFVAQPPLFNKPWLTRSVYDLWSRRWHQIFRPGFHQVAYNPVRQLFGKSHVTVGRVLGTIAVFMCSGLMHDYIILGMLGYSNITKPGIFGYQTLFFFLQALATIVSVKSPRLPTWLARALTWIWVLYTAPLFVEPYIRLGLHLNAEVPGFPKFMDDPIGKSICPYGPRNLI